MLEGGAFFGEACLTGQTVRTATSKAHDPCVLIRIDKGAMIRVLHEQPTFAELFLS
jgi:CRP-like cAMP-binding protein